MTAPHIRIFPHSREEFPSPDLLMVWLLTALKARGGKYLIKTASTVADLPAGSLVLFRCRQVIVGEAVVARLVLEREIGHTLSGKNRQYGASVLLSPSSIRVYAPPLEIEALQDAIGDSPNVIKGTRAKTKIEDWSVYAKLLAHHVGKCGTFI